MAGLQILTPAEIDALSTELDVFTSGRTPGPELIQKKLYPPLPICSDTLIWGFEIMRSAKSQGLRQVNCLIIPSCPRSEMLALALKLENRAGSFTWPEKQKMLGFLDTPGGSSATEGLPANPALVESLSDLSPLIEGRRDPQLAEKIAAFAALPKTLKTLVAEGQLDLKSAVRVRSLPEAVFARLQAGALTFSQRRQFLNELFEVSRKRKLAGQKIRDVADRALRGPQPIETVHRLRYPFLTDLETRFAALEQRLLKGSGVQVKPPPYYEGDAFTVEFRFNSSKSFSRKLNALRSLEGHLDALFELLH
jgi:hypothetical protein